MLYLIILLNLTRFIGLNHSPPGFYVDEAAGAAQVLCISQTGADFYGHSLSLFTPGAGDAFYTPFYIYGQIIWTKIFGYSPAGFRSFLALSTSLSVLFLYLWVRNKSNPKIALYVAFSASIMPWAFQFSRIAWDPPLAVLFLVMALWASSLKKGYWTSGIFLALACYTYSPLRITAILLALFLPGLQWKKKGLCAIIFSVTCIPLFLQLLSPEFLARSQSLVLWSPSPSNPFSKANSFELIFIFLQQVWAHLSPVFLFIKGDANLRHSLPWFGMLSWLDAFAVLIASYFLLRDLTSKTKITYLEPTQTRLLLIAYLGIVASIIPAALTNEGIPHALRSIAAWPFFALFTGTILYQAQVGIQKRWFLLVTLCLGLSFFSLYLTRYFRDYPTASANAFLIGADPMELAYKSMHQQGLACHQAIAQKQESAKPLRTPIDQEILFNSRGNGIEYLRSGWYAPEPWGVWSNGKKAILDFPLNGVHPKQVRLHLKGFISPTHPKQSIEIWMDNALQKSISLNTTTSTSISISIPPNISAKNNLELIFYISNPISPIQAGVSDSDDRMLGIGLISAHLK